MRICDTSTACMKPAVWRRLLEHYDAMKNTQAACDQHKDKREGWVKIHPDAKPEPKK